MEYKNVNYIYVVVNSKNEIYDISTDCDLMVEQCNSFNRMTETYKNELPFRLEEIELGTKIIFE